MNTFEVLSELCQYSGVSGDECSIANAAKAMLEPYGETAVDPALGNVVCRVGQFDENKKTVLLEAHMDEIGMIVTYITDDGFLKVSACGGIDNRVLLAQQVTVYGKEKLTGIITSTPPHLEKDSSGVPNIGDIYIDIGLSGERAKELVSLGDRVLIENVPQMLKNNRVTAKAIDNRSSMAAVMLVLEILMNAVTKYNLIVMFSSQEEVGERGAKVGGYASKADKAIVVDVSFAKTHYDNDEGCGVMGKGAMIGIAPSLSRKMSDEFIALAEKMNIPYQIEVMNGTTGTDADAIGISGYGKETVTVSIPEKHMHTPVEVVDLSDIENTARLIAAYLYDFDNDEEALL